MSKKTLLSCTASLLFLGGSAHSVTYNIEYSIGGNATVFPATSKGFLIVDPAGDGFDFVKTPALLEGKSESKADDQWGNNDLVVFSGLVTEIFPPDGRGFNIPPTKVSTDKWKEGDKVALVWFPEGTSTKGSNYSYYTSDSVESQLGTIPFKVSKNGATDSTIALGVTPKASGTIGSTGGSAGPPSGGGGGGSSQVQKSKKGGSKSSSAKKSSGGSKKSSANKSSGSKKSSVKKSKGNKSKGKKKSGGKKK
jgi:hypothetical protein